MRLMPFRGSGGRFRTGWMRLAIIAGISLFLGCSASRTVSRPDSVMSEPVSFRNGDVTLSGTLFRAVGQGRHPAVVVYHAAGGGTRDYRAYQHLSTELPAAGFAVLLFDRRGSGESTGDFSKATFRDLAADGIAGIALLKSRPDIDPARIGVWGMSQGGWLGPLAATMSDDVSFVVSVSGPGVSPAVQMDYAAAHALEASGQSADVVRRALQVRGIVNDYYRGRATKPRAEEAVAAVHNEPWFEHLFLPRSGDLPPNPQETKWYLELDYDPLPVISRVRVPIAFFFAETDRWVPVDESIANIRRSAASLSLLTITRISRADHLMETGPPDSGGATSEEYVSLLLKWLRSVAPS